MTNLLIDNPPIGSDEKEVLWEGGGVKIGRYKKAYFACDAEERADGEGGEWVRDLKLGSWNKRLAMAIVAPKSKGKLEKFIVENPSSSSASFSSPSASLTSSLCSSSSLSSSTNSPLSFSAEAYYYNEENSNNNNNNNNTDSIFNNNDNYHNNNIPNPFSDDPTNILNNNPPNGSDEKEVLWEGDGITIGRYKNAYFVYDSVLGEEKCKKLKFGGTYSRHLKMYVIPPKSKMKLENFIAATSSSSSSPSASLSSSFSSSPPRSSSTSPYVFTSSSSPSSSTTSPSSSTTSPSSPLSLPWTDEQKKIINFLVEGERGGEGEGGGNAGVSAVAGGGKTTTMLGGVSEWVRRRREEGRDGGKVLVVGFGKKNMGEWNDRVGALGVGDWVSCCTFHSLGKNLFFEKPKIETGSQPWYNNNSGNNKWSAIRHRLASSPSAKKLRIAKEIITNTNNHSFNHNNVVISPLSLVQLTSMCQMNLISEEEEVRRLVSEQGVEEEEGGVVRLVEKMLVRCREEVRLDFDDMLWKPHVMDLEPIQPLFYDLIIVDEAQDMNPAMLSLLFRILRFNKKKEVRTIYVGDRRQSIFDFMCADGAMDVLKKELGVLNEFTLTQARRCPLSHTELARNLVPNLSTSRTDEGEIGLVTISKERKNYDEFDNILMGGGVGRGGKGGFVLCLRNKFVGHCFRLVRKGVKAQIVGETDVGGDLRSLIKHGPDNVEEFLLYLDKKEEMEKRVALKNRAVSRLRFITDFYTAARELTREVEREIQGRGGFRERFGAVVSELFWEGGEGDEFEEGTVYFSSVHRSKGREHDRVFVLHPGLFEKKDINLAYVALTRSKNELYFVVEKEKEEEDWFPKDW
eukprot:CAMPEP_0201510986 /NCGR_PEP_ID=MMETSP0161_2-20130828/3504_1 /ASSEMBLY_ACC=CAM_ASM_000251 /TAXON_ID=180227 /ORGANISM="Neoparamoeba aestuarina, Strain SoJaBio B1-5/56/2" /LENGTH=854 /DNA_ID=CAMNT_0047906297 /DNA_START=160 /DNA_END=2721 /DNA_ORIENTATION=+